MKKQNKIIKILVILTKSISFLLFFIIQNLHLLAEASSPVRKDKGSVWGIADKRVTTLAGAQSVLLAQLGSGCHPNDFPCPGCHWANHCDKCYSFADCAKCYTFADCAQCYGVAECQSAHSCVKCNAFADCAKCHASVDCPKCHTMVDCPFCHFQRDCPSCHTVEDKPYK